MAICLLLKGKLSLKNDLIKNILELIERLKRYKILFNAHTHQSQKSSKIDKNHGFCLNAQKEALNSLKRQKQWEK